MTGKKPLITYPTLKTTEPGVPIYENLVIGNFLYALGLKIGARQHDYCRHRSQLSRPHKGRIVTAGLAACNRTVWRAFSNLATVPLIETLAPPSVIGAPDSVLIGGGGPRAAAVARSY